jgi:hypothetical protein
MRDKVVSLADLALISSTRGMIGFGLGLLLANKLTKLQRRTLGMTLFLTGAISTIPILIKVFRQQEERAVNLKAA